MGTKVRNAVGVLSAAVALAMPDAVFGLAGFGSMGDAISGVYLTPNDENWRVHSVNIETSTARQNIINVLGGQYGPTDLDLFHYAYSTDCTGSDLCILDQDMGASGYYGRTMCAYGTLSGVDPTKVCTSFTLIILNQYSGAGYPSGIGISPYNICHEVGHSIGLRHRPGTVVDNGTSCMRTAYELAPGGTSVPSTSNIHIDEVDAINANYK